MNRLYIEEENDLFSLCTKDGTLKLQTVLRTGMFPIEHNDFDLALGFAKLYACKLHSLQILGINHENL